MTFFQFAIEWFLQPGNWGGADGIPARILQHLGYSALSLAVAAAVALPLGMLIGHTGRGGFFVVNVANAARALPTLGVLILVVIVAGIGLVPVLVPLIVLAVPPILVNTYEGIRQVDADLREAARGMGMKSGQLLLGVEIPVALPLIILGLRTAAIQIVSTATIAAYVSLGGLGRFIFDGLARQDYAMVTGGAVLVAALAVLVEIVFVILQRIAVSPGIRPRVSAVG